MAINDLGDREYLMGLALEQAQKALAEDEVPVGAIITDEVGKIIARGHNRRESTFNPVGHAEILATIAGAKAQKSWRLTGHHLLVTLEPCPMCMAMICQVRFSRLTFGAFDAKGGALSLGHNLHGSKTGHYGRS